MEKRRKEGRRVARQRVEEEKMTWTRGAKEGRAERREV